MSESRDVLGNPVTESEQRLLDAYRLLLTLHADPELAPHAKANVGEAVAALWQAVNNLALVDDRPGV